MAKGVNIPIAADASGVIKGTKDVEGALDKVIDSLDDVGDAGKDTERALDRSLDGAGDDAEKLERKMRDAFDTVKKESRKAGDDVGDNIKRGSKEASQGLEDLDNNARSNAKEVAASFDGSAESIADGFQGLAAEAFEGWGPAGVAAGVAVAAGIGIITSETEKARERAEELEQKVRDLATAILESGDPAKSMREQFVDTMTEWVTGGELFGRVYGDVRKELEAAGLATGEIDTVTRAMAGSVEDQAEATRILAERQQYFKEVFAETRSSTTEGYAENMKILMDYTDKVGDSAQQIADAEARAQEAARLTGQVSRGEVGETLKRYQDMHREIDNLPASKTVTLSVEADLTAAERSIRTWRPVITGTFRAGQAVV